MFGPYRVAIICTLSITSNLGRNSKNSLPFSPNPPYIYPNNRLLDLIFLQEHRSSIFRSKDSIVSNNFVKTLRYTVALENILARSKINDVTMGNVTLPSDRQVEFAHLVFICYHFTKLQGSERTDLLFELWQGQITQVVSNSKVERIHKIRCLYKLAQNSKDYYFVSTAVKIEPSGNK